MTDLDPKPPADPVAMLERAIRLLREEYLPSPAVAMALAQVEAIRDAVTQIPSRLALLAP